jgi:hypothetical protein
MPTLHRLACLRDDVVFLIYLYQKWVYPEDKRRRNEFGQVGEDDLDESEEEEEEEEKKKEETMPLLEKKHEGKKLPSLGKESLGVTGSDLKQRKTATSKESS